MRQNIKNIRHGYRAEWAQLNPHTQKSSKKVIDSFLDVTFHNFLLRSRCHNEFWWLFPSYILVLFWPYF